MKLLSGGQVADKVSYTSTSAQRAGEVAGLEDAYLQFTDLGGSGISVIAGQSRYPIRYSSASCGCRTKTFTRTECVSAKRAPISRTIAA